jgi:phenylalanyl-tRNA synthetase beta chain
MRVPVSWLRDFAPFGDDVDALLTGLDELGLVVEGVERVGEGLGDVVVARVLATRRHPDADRIQLVDVDPGTGEAIQVVCGAFNFGAGDLVPLAPVGATLPGGFEIGRRKMRGEWSNGMLCSPAELRLSDDHDGIMVLAEGLAIGTPLAEALGVEPDVVVDVDVTPNRPDAMSVAGVARDLAAKLRLPFAIPEPAALGDGPATASLTSVEVDDLDVCPRFTARVLDGVAVGASPRWLSSRLTLAGMRPISNVVDVSNYVMLELGQPTHPYDRSLLAGGGLRVRRARPGERLTTLDGVERTFTGEECLICDAEDEPVGVGGIMGGASSEIAETTRTVVLEAAYFDAISIARTSKRMGIRTEASARFERGCDPEGIERAVARFCELLAAMAGPDLTVSSGLLDVRAPAPSPTRVLVRTERVNGVLGTALTDEQIRSYLAPIGFQAQPVEGGGAHQVTIPTWRPDSSREIDVVEEVARHHGYADIGRTMPPVTRVGGLTPYQRSRRLVREVLVGAGVTEALTSSFLGPGDLERAGLDAAAVAVSNPLQQEESLLRTSLRPGLLRALVHNASHRNPEVSLFDVGRVFLPPAPGARLPDEREQLAVALARRDATAAKRVWDVLAGALALEGVELVATGAPGMHAGRTVRVRAGGHNVGLVGEIDPAVVAAHDLDGRVGWVELDLEPLLAAPRRARVYEAVSRFPSSDIDLAFTVDDGTPAGAVEGTLRQAGGDLLVRLRLFDVYRGDQVGEGRRSLAYRLRFNALDRTLTDEEVAEARRRCIEAVEAAHPAQLRA